MLPSDRSISATKGAPDGRVAKENKSRRYSAAAWLLFSGWLILAPVIFYLIFFPNHRWFIEDVNRIPVSLPKLAATGGVRVLHFIDEACPCTKFSLPHIQSLQEAYPHLEHLLVNPDDSIAAIFHRELGYAFSSPSAALINHMGEVVYFGPYSSGSFCGEGDDLLVAALRKANTAGGGNPVSFLHFGCFCGWPDSI